MEFFRGIAKSLGVKITGVGLIFLAHVMLARALTEADYGIFMYAVQIAMLGAVGVSLGLEQAALRFVPVARVSGNQQDYARFYRVALTLGVGTGMGIALLLLAAGMGLAGTLPATVGAVLVPTAMLMPVVVLLNIAEGITLARKEVLFGQLTQNILLPLALMLLAGAIMVDLLEATAAHALAVQVIAMGGAAIFLMRRSRPARWVPLPEVAAHSALKAGAEPAPTIRQYLRVGLPLSASSFLITFMRRGDLVVLGFFAGAAELAFYAVAQRVAGLASFGQMAGNAVLGPVVSEAFAAGNKLKMQENVNRALAVTVVTSLPVFAICFAVPALLMSVFGERYASAWPVLVILAVGQVANVLTGPVGPVLTVTGHQDVYARVIAVSAGSALALFLLGGWLGGLTGVSVASALVVALRNIWLCALVQSRLGIRCYFTPGLVPEMVRELHGLLVAFRHRRR